MTRAHEQGARAPAATIIVVLVASPVWAQAVNEQLSTDGVTLLVAAGPALAGLGLFLLQRLWPRILPRLVVIPTIRRRWATLTRVFARAQIATILMPLVNEVFDRGQAKFGEVLIVGSDGAYLIGKKKRKLHDAIRAWTRRGMTVRYLLVEPVDKALEELDELRQTLEASDSLEILPLWALPNSADEGLGALVTVLKTLHPTLICFTNDNGEEKRTMWIESEHLPRKMHSSGNRWVPPEAMGEQAGPNETWNDVFSGWKDRLATLCTYIQPYEVSAP